MKLIRREDAGRFLKVDTSRIVDLNFSIGLKWSNRPLSHL